MGRFDPPVTATLVILVFVTVSYAVNGLDSRKLDESGDQSEECTPCGQTTPPPPPACPPPPALPPPSPKKPPKYCPPPPASIIYITGPPGSLYPIDENYNGVGRRFEAGFLSLVAGGLVGLLVLGRS